MTEIFRLGTDADGVATITWDLPGVAMNVLNEQGMEELEACIDAALSAEAVRGIVITSGKRDFAGGMDLNLLADLKRRAAESGGNPAEPIFAMI
ncbi:MAG TPA: enoyl-CoA hydratase-related protein, partial [Paracoccaceae bacterium]|nr:enoyl-CoA hydratase-related protein [Paracoccaceae bacterium]